MYEGKKSTDGWCPVVLISSADFITAQTGKGAGDITVKYSFEGATSLTSYSPTADDWKEAGEGKYWLRIGASEFGNEGVYEVSVACSGAVTFNFPVQVRDKLLSEAVDDLDTLLTRLSADRAGYLDNLSAGAVALASVCTEGRLGELDAANIPADVDALLTRLSAIRAGYLDNLSAGAVALASVCTEGRLGELDAANIPADVDALLTRLSAIRAGYLDNLSAGAVALASVCTEGRLGELDAANIPADVDALLTRLSADRAGYLDNLSAGAVALEASLAALNDISVADILAVIIDGTGDKAISLGGVLKVLLAVLAGVSAGGGTGTNTYKDADGAAVVVEGDVDANGNRTSVTVTV